MFKNFTKIALVALVMAALVCWKSITAAPEDRPSDPPAQEDPGGFLERTAPPPIRQPSQEEMEQFVYGDMFPSLEWARENYPIPSIRRRVQRFFERLEGRELYFNVSPILHPKVMAIGTSYLDDNGNKTLCIIVPVAMHMQLMCEGNHDLFVDRLIGVILHEEFHLFEQQNFHSGDIDSETLIAHESEAWWLSIKEIYLPMIRNHRLGSSDGATGGPFEEALYNAFMAYERANGNPDSPAWQAFARYATGQ